MISGHWRHQKNWQQWNVFHNRNPKNISNSGSIVGQVHSCSRGVLWWWPPSVTCKYTGMSMLAIKSFQ